MPWCGVVVALNVRDSWCGCPHVVGYIGSTIIRCGGCVNTMNTGRERVWYVGDGGRYELSTHMHVNVLVDKHGTHSSDLRDR